MSERLRFGIVGAGAIANSYAQALARTGRARLAAVCDVRPEAASALASAFSCRWHESHLAMAEAEPLDAAIVCTPPATHPAITTDLLERGLPVLCEKPMSVDSTSAREMIAAARRTGRTLTMASKFRYVEDVARAKAIVASGILGDIVLFENAFTARVDMRNRWNADAEVSGGGVLIDNGTHSLDLVRFFLGPLADVHVVEGRRSQGLPVEETVRIFVRSVAGVLGSIDLSWSIDKELDNYISIHGSQGTVCVGWKLSKYRQASSRDWVVFGNGYDKLQAFASQIDNFAGSLLGEEKLVISAEDGLASVEAVEAAYVDLAHSHWVPIGKRADAPAPAA